jgi:hypothetical protein
MQLTISAAQNRQILLRGLLGKMGGSRTQQGAPGNGAI